MNKAECQAENHELVLKDKVPLNLYKSYMLDLGLNLSASYTLFYATLPHFCNKFQLCFCQDMPDKLIMLS